MGFFDKIKAGLTRTKENISNIGHSFDQLFAGELDDDFYDELEEALILSDMGVETAMKAVEELRRRAKAEKIKNAEEGRACLRTILTEFLEVGETGLHLETRPSVALFIGVNGVGKTTTIGKLSAHLKGEGKRVLMAAGQIPAGPPPPTSWRSGLSAAEWISSASTRGPILRQWSLTPSPRPEPAGPTSSWWIPPGGCTTSRT